MKNKIVFVWQGITDMKPEKWRDGLWLALQYLETDYDVIYAEPTDEIPEDAVVLYWEAPITWQSPENGLNYRKIQSLPNRKALLFAGGRITPEWIKGFDHVFYESKINKDELDQIGISNSLAFGINEKIFRPINVSKKYDGIHAGTCASWKRQELVGESIGEKGLVVGRHQDSDPYPFNRCKESGCAVMDSVLPKKLAVLVNKSHTCLQTSDYWGGGQRVTLEAMACNVPVICMEDSPKNREFVEESGCGVVVNPSPQDIRNAVENVKEIDWGSVGRDYIMSKWTGKHYSENLKKWIEQIIN